MKCITVILILCTAFAHAQSGTEIIKKAADRLEKLKTISYNIYIEGPEEKITADVTIARGVDLPVFEVSKIKTTGIAVDSNGSRQIAYSYDGSSFDFIDLKSRHVVKLDSPSYPKISRTGLMPYTSVALPPYWQKKPFDPLLRQLKAADKLEDTVIYNRPCYKIKVTIQIESRTGESRASESYWFIGKQDFLVYGHRSLLEKKFLRIRSVDEQLDTGYFSLTGSKQVKKITGLEPLNDGLLSVGTKAPYWSLPSSLNKNISLAELKGKVVLLDFWGTWCVPCLRAMPDIQEISDYFRSKQVVVIGVSVEMEKSADPLGYVRKKGFTYPIVLNGHKITKEYKVHEFPSIYIIDKKGNIVHAEHSGNRENFKADIISRINKALSDNR